MRANLDVDSLTWAEWLALGLVAVFVLLPVLAWRAFVDGLTRVRA